MTKNLRRIEKKQKEERKRETNRRGSNESVESGGKVEPVPAGPSGVAAILTAGVKRPVH